MAIFIDSSDPKEIKDLFAWGVLSGVTTNPLIIAKEAPGEWRVRGQFTGFVKIPDFTRVLRLQPFGCRAAESRAHIIDVTLQQGESAVVAGGVHGLGKVDNDRPVDIQQNVEVGKVAVDQPRA